MAHAPRHRGGITSRPPREDAGHRRPRPRGGSGRRDETSRQGQGAGRDWSRAVEQPGQTRAWRCTAQRDAPAATRGLPKAIRRQGVPAQRPIDGRAAPAAALKSDHAAPGTALVLRTITSLHHRSAPDQRAGQRGPRPLRGCNACAAAHAPLRGLARRPRIQHRQRGVEAGHEGRTAAALCYALAASSPSRQGPLPLHDLLSKIGDTTVRRTLCFSKTTTMHELVIGLGIKRYEFGLLL